MSLARRLYPGGVFGLLVCLIVAAHLTFVGYVTFGGFLALRWPVTIWAHLGVAGYGVAIEVFDFTCPLTTAEVWARERAGMAPLDPGGFVDHYLSGPLFGNADGVDLAVLLVCVLTSWVLFLTITVRRGSGVPGARPARTADVSRRHRCPDSAPDNDVR